MNSAQSDLSDELSDSFQAAPAKGCPYESTRSVAITETEAPADDSDTMLEIRQCTTLTYRETTEQYLKIFMGTSDEMFLDESGAFYHLEIGYGQTTRQDEQFDYHDEVMLWENDQNYDTKIDINPEQNCPYRDLLACNGRALHPHSKKLGHQADRL